MPGSPIPIAVVGILMKGPDIDPSKIPDTFWLHRLHRDILEIDPGNPETARRERNSLMVSGGQDRAAGLSGP